MDSDPTEGGCSLKALMGDMNAYAMEDPIKYFESVGYIDVDYRFNGDDAYSYGFDGQIGTLDYVLANSAFNNLITGASSWHVNADEAAALDYNTDFGKDKNIFDADMTVRFSDHDPMVVGFDLGLPLTLMKIHDIQGNGDSSPHVGKLVYVEAVVIGEFIIPLSCSSSKSKLQLCFILLSIDIISTNLNVLTSCPCLSIS